MIIINDQDLSFQFHPKHMQSFIFLRYCIRVSNELGAGRVNAAHLAVCIAVFLVITEGSLAAIIIILGHKLWVYCYSRDEKVVRYIGKMLLLIAGSHFLDGIQSVLSGLSTFLYLI